MVRHFSLQSKSSLSSKSIRKSFNSETMSCRALTRESSFQPTSPRRSLLLVEFPLPFYSLYHGPSSIKIGERITVIISSPSPRTRPISLL